MNETWKSDFVFVELWFKINQYVNDINFSYITSHVLIQLSILSKYISISYLEISVPKWVNPEKNLNQGVSMHKCVKGLLSSYVELMQKEQFSTGICIKHSKWLNKWHGGDAIYNLDISQAPI